MHINYTNNDSSAVKCSVIGWNCSNFRWYTFEKLNFVLHGTKNSENKTKGNNSMHKGQLWFRENINWKRTHFLYRCIMTIYTNSTKIFGSISKINLCLTWRASTLPKPMLKTSQKRSNSLKYGNESLPTNGQIQWKSIALPPVEFAPTLIFS